jgi:hypothetical protein
VAATVARLDPVTVPTRSGLIPQRSYLSPLPPKATIHRVFNAAILLASKNVIRFF